VGGAVLLQRFFKEEVEIREGREEGRAAGYILTITDRFTNRIIPTVTLLAILSV
jgi:hypothetical protein